MGTPVTFGSVVRQRRIAGAVLTEAVYDAGSRGEPHAHDHASLLWVASGHLTETVGSRRYACTVTDVMWKQAGLTHANRVDRSSRVVVVELLPELLEELADQEARMPDAPAHVSGAPAALFARLAPLLHEIDVADALAAQELVVEVLTGLDVRADALPAGVPSWLELVRQRLHDEPCARISLGDLARRVGVHPVYLARAFRRRFGCSVTEYLHGRRIDLAVAALASGDEEIGRLALRLGYYDHSHFCRAFSRATGMPPSSYRAIARRAD